MPLPPPKFTNHKNHREPEHNWQILTILDEYDEMGFKGPQFVLPCGEVICEDMWKSSLEMRLSDMDTKILPLYTFSLDNFLQEKIDLEGTKIQSHTFYATRRFRRFCQSFEASKK